MKIQLDATLPAFLSIMHSHTYYVSRNKKNVLLIIHGVSFIEIQVMMIDLIIFILTMYKRPSSSFHLVSAVPFYISFIYWKTLLSVQMVPLVGCCHYFMAHHHYAYYHSTQRIKSRIVLIHKCAFSLAYGQHIS